VRALRGLLVVVLAVALAGPAAAHLALRYPTSRYGDDVLKVPPCGLLHGARSETVTELKPGEQIEVVWNEYVDHPGHFRIAFDDDGDDDFVDPACLSGCDTRTPEIELYSNPTVLLDGIADTPLGGQSSATVTLPDIACERCTLQVIQVMYDKPPYVSPGNDIYYQCADLVLRREPPRPEACAGDCDGDGEVVVAELIAGIRIALGADALAECPACDSDHDGRVTVDDVVRAVTAALRGCVP
jgi:hypothetical protein